MHVNLCVSISAFIISAVILPHNDCLPFCLQSQQNTPSQAKQVVEKWRSVTTRLQKNGGKVHTKIFAAGDEFVIDPKTKFLDSSLLFELEASGRTRAIIWNKHYKADIEKLKEEVWSPRAVHDRSEPLYQKEFPFRFIGTSFLHFVVRGAGLIDSIEALDFDLIVVPKNSDQRSDDLLVELIFKEPSVFEIQKALLWFNTDSTLPFRIDKTYKNQQTETLVFSDWINVNSTMLPQKMLSFLPGLDINAEVLFEKYGGKHLYSYVEYDRIPDVAEFYLPHYGLPEVPIVQTIWRTWYWAVIILVLFLGAILILRSKLVNWRES